MQNSPSDPEVLDTRTAGIIVPAAKTNSTDLGVSKKGIALKTFAALAVVTILVGVLSISTTSVTFRIENSNASNSAFTIYWMATGN